MRDICAAQLPDAPHIARFRIPRPHSSLAASHLCVILERFWITPLPPAEALSAAERGRIPAPFPCLSFNSLALYRERARVRDICAARLPDAPHIARVKQAGGGRT